MTQTTKSRKAQAAIVILATYIFTHLSRICFTVRSSDGSTTYNTCFTNGHGSCTCDGNAVWHKECKHIKFLAPIAAEKLAQQQAKEATRTLVAQSVFEAECAVVNRKFEAWQREHGYAPLPLVISTVTKDAENTVNCDDSYEAWKRENGLDGKLSREAYCQEFSIY